MIAVLNACTFEYTLIEDTPENRTLMESLRPEQDTTGPYLKHDQFDKVVQEGKNVGSEGIVQCDAVFTYSPEF